MPGTHQNAAAEGVVPAHSAWGDPVSGTQGIVSGGDIQPAGLHSTLPYRPPKRRARDNPDKLLCSAEDCKAFPMQSTGYCAGHSRSLGLVEWDKGGRKPWKKAEGDDDAE